MKNRGYDLWEDDFFFGMSSQSMGKAQSGKNEGHHYEVYDEAYEEYQPEMDHDSGQDFKQRPNHNPWLMKRRWDYRGMEKDNSSTCQELADIIGGEVIASSPACVVQRLRNINASILGRHTRSPLALPFALSFENNQGGKTLNLGETVILQKEINPFLSALRKRGIIVTAVHNHWLFEEPRLMYMHWENVGDPFKFAKNSIEAAREAGLF